jgi:ubiquitin carboxyl-terminal hydrolase 10
VRLLTSRPGHPTATTAGVSYASTTPTTTNPPPSTKIRPRGLINSGNMCFANSVLQIMVHCPPFHRLFAELGKVLGTSGVGSGGLASSVSAGMNGMVGKNGNGRAAEASAYPLVEATAEFLKEFVVDDDRSKEKGNANANVNGKIASGSASGSGSPSTSRTSSSRGGKGKERERERGDSIHDASGGVVRKREDDNGWTESFWPTYVYDAMKVKKRFELMRVSFISFHLVLRLSLLPFSCCLLFLLPFLSFPFLCCWKRCRQLALINLVKFPCYSRPNFE